MFSFSARKKVVDASTLVRRVIDLTSPNRPRPGDQRTEIRYNRSIPVVVCGWKRGKPDLRSTVVGFTTDLCDRGIGLVFTKPIEYEDLLVILLVDPSEVNDPVHIRCGVEKRLAPCLGLHRFGLSITEAIESSSSSLAKLESVTNEIMSLMFGDVMAPTA